MDPLSAISSLSATPIQLPNQAQAPHMGLDAELKSFGLDAELKAIPLPSVSPAHTSGATPFESLLQPLIRDVNDKQAAAGQSLQALLAGQTDALHPTMIALEEASVSFQLMVEVRNKLLESYQELMRMQV